jgi:tetratricopeptide (TPR) repeat protein
MYVLTISALALVLGATQQPSESVPLYDNLGDHHRTITTSSPVAQKYFDQGLRLVYAFNHAEAIASFEQALTSDAECAMCYWGIALAYGPNINVPMDSASGVAAYAAASKAAKLAGKTTANEQAMIGAIVARYGSDPVANRAQLDSAYARAMSDVAQRFTDDDDAATLYADALMNLSPWIYWTDDAKPRVGTPEMLKALERVTARNQKHAGACHLYIHAVEAKFPKRAEPCADRLAGLMPGAGHIVHMPGHIFIRVGRYADAIQANQHAIHEDETFIADRSPQGVYPLGYYPHNYHFLNFAAMMAANEEMAVKSAMDLAEKAQPELLRMPGLAGSMQQYLQTPLFAYLRFDRWDRILATPPPPADLPYATGLSQYARGIAQARSGNTEDAQTELAALRKSAAKPELQELPILSYNSAASVLAIAEATLTGEVAAARKDWTEAERQLTRAAELEDRLIYIEPPEWPVTARQHLGRIQNEAGRFAAAQKTYEADLVRFPENVWALRGLAMSLEKQGKIADAKAVQARLTKAMSGSGKPAGHSH